MTSILLLLLLQQPVSAQDINRQTFDEGKRAYNINNFNEALERFQRAYIGSGNPNLLFNIAQCHRKLGNKQEAITFYKAYIQERPDATNRVQVEEKIKDLEKPVPNKVYDEKEDMVDPYLTDTYRVSKNTVRSDLVHIPPNSEQKKSQVNIPVKWIGVGVTGILGGISLFSGLNANNTFNTLKNSCGNTVEGCSKSQIDGLHSKANITNLLIATTLASAVTTGVFFYLDYKSAGVSIKF